MDALTGSQAAIVQAEAADCIAKELVAADEKVAAAAKQKAEKARARKAER